MFIIDETFHKIFINTKLISNPSMCGWKNINFDKYYPQV